MPNCPESVGLVSEREDSGLKIKKSFQLTLTFFDNSSAQSHTYDTRGRITHNSSLGNYVYSASSYQQTGLNTLPTPAATYYLERPLQQISYNAFKSPVEIAEQGKEKISFQYNAALQRAHMYYGDETADKMSRRYRRHYSEDGSMEITNDIQSGTTSFVFYMGGDAYSAPAIWKEIHTSAQTTQQLYFLHRDHLGSIVMITNDAGNVVEKRQFDAWGNIVKLEDANGNALTAFVILDRGYTGHEHLLGVGLIHMNGRLYDPKLHRFLQPDNYVQDPYNSQNYNRYGYVLNNPLSYVDPSGEIAFVPLLLLIGKAALVGAGISGVGYTASVAFSPGGFNNWNWGQFGKSLAIGAVSGVVTAGIGSAFGEIGKFSHELLRAGAHGFANGTISSVTGGDFMSGFLSGGLGSLGSSGFQAVAKGFSQTAAGTIGFGALSGGIGAELGGGDFWRGAATGAMVAGLNHTVDHGGDPTKKQIEAMGATASAVGYTSDGAALLMASHKGKAFYYTNIEGNVKWIPTSRVNSVISKVGKAGIFVGFAVDGLMYYTGNQSFTQTASNVVFGAGMYLMKLGVRANIAATLIYGALTSGWDMPGRPITVQRTFYAQPDNTRVFNLKR